ncbi:MAG: condensation domain-containing protein, partial [Dermatophilaceae bacterium]
TEAAIDVSYWPASPDYPGGIVPIGKPIANVHLYVVDRHLRLQPIGVPGELCIGGTGLAEGYYNRDDLTKAAFVTGPFEDVPDDRLYRTGDLARFRTDGQIEYLGRIDNQVKLHGLRIELGEIEAAVLSVPCVREAAAILHESSGHQMLVAYVAADNFDVGQAIALIKERLPEFMVPRRFIEIPALPTTANGKLDRNALPEPLSPLTADDADDAETAPPRTAEERVLAEIWQDVLGVEKFGLDTNLFRLGGDSITTIRIAARLREAGYPVQVKDVFGHATIRQLAARLATPGSDVGEDAEAVAVAQAAVPFFSVPSEERSELPESAQDAWPLTRLQSGMIYHSMLHARSPLYHDVFSYDVQAPLDRELLLQALRSVTDRHQQLRSCFDLGTFGEPMQLVFAGIEPQLEFDQDPTLERTRDFDLEQAPLVRFLVDAPDENRFTLTISFHHAILDGWSVALVIEEIRRAYSGILTGSATAPIPYSAYVALERQALADEAQAAFWTETVAGVTPALVASRSGTATVQPATTTRTVPEGLAAGLRSLANDLGVTPKSAFLAVHLHVLGQLTGRSDTISGLVVNGRPEVSGGEQTAGLFLNTIPFPIQLGDLDWPALIRRTFDFEQKAMAHRRFPLAEILRRDSRDELFDSIFNYTDFHVYQSEPDESAAITGARYFEQTNFAAVVHLANDRFSDSTTLTVNYDAARIDSEVVDRYLDRFIATAAIESDTAVDPIREIVAKAIGLARIGADDNYLELGVDSITAIRVVAKLKRRGLGAALQDVFEYPTARRLAQHLQSTAEGASGHPTAQAPVQRPDTTLAPGSAATRPSEHTVPFGLSGRPRVEFPAGVVDAYPATSMQVEMVRHHDADPKQAVYHDVFSYRLGLALDEPLLRSVLQQLVDRHETLRTSFDLGARPRPLQLVHSVVSVPLEVVDMSAPDFDDWFESEKAVGFDWAKPPLIRFFAHRHTPDAFTLTLSFHHSIIDGWSLSLFIRDLIQGYTTALEPAAPAPPYRDYVAAELRSRSSEQQREFWSTWLGDAEPLRLPRSEDIDPDSRWSETAFTVQRSTQQALTALSHRAGIPLKHTMLAAHITVLTLLHDRPTVLTHVFTGGRLEEEGAEEAIGLFLNFIPFRQDTTGRTWRSLVEETFAADRRTLPHRRYPLAEIERDLGKTPLAETAFNYTQFTAYGDAAKSHVLQSVKWFEHTHFALLANVGHDLHQDRLVVTLNADARVLPRRFVEALADLYGGVLGWLAADEDASVTETPVEIAKLATLLGDVMERELP